MTEETDEELGVRGNNECEMKICKMKRTITMTLTSMLTQRAIPILMRDATARQFSSFARSEL